MQRIHGLLWRHVFYFRKINGVPELSCFALCDGEILYCCRVFSGISIIDGGKGTNTGGWGFPADEVDDATMKNRDPIFVNFFGKG